MASQGTIRALKLEFKNLQEEPVEGFRVKLSEDNNIFEWEVAIFGPPNTLYAGGYFRARMRFPHDYPFHPPSIKFLTKFWHPNVYDAGNLCISILHPPVEDPASGESVSERWNPTQNVRTILLSVISLLNEPNVNSPANIEASVMYKRYIEGIDNQYADIVQQQVNATKIDAERAGVVVPLTVSEYCRLGTTKSKKDSDDLPETVEFCDDVLDDFSDDYSVQDETEEDSDKSDSDKPNS